MNWFLNALFYRAGTSVYSSHPRRGEAEAIVARFRREPIPLFAYFLISTAAAAFVATLISLSLAQWLGTWLLFVFVAAWQAFGEGEAWGQTVLAVIRDLDNGKSKEEILSAR